MTGRQSLALEALGLQVRYPGSGTSALALDELRVNRGQTLCVLGPSGSGKTTFLDCLAGLVRPDRGSLIVLGQDLSSLGDAARRRFRLTRLGSVSQRFELVPYLTALENVLLPARLRPSRSDRARDLEEARGLLDAMGLTALSRRKPGQLSCGEAQRVAVCRALLGSPELCLADEPTSNLDPAAAGLVLELLLARCEKTGGTLVLTTHDRGLAAAFDLVIDLGEGRRAW
ncbi:MAG: hypothetical protein A2284_02745 [Deltaproteobacteria bacterium RIFOXYA12_FULL_61_11]|nr:MAG: hypothetical protein A2284_02745 [Deltaproteobacteria bacterium RIFOXYA12_FULL_61_11]